MKKILSIALLAMLAMALPLPFVGCKKGSAENVDPVVGTWEYTISREMNSNGEVAEEYFDEKSPNTKTFNKDNSGYSTSKSGKKSPFKWTKKDNKYFVQYYVEDGTLDPKGDDFCLENGELVLSSKDLRIIYRKVK